MLIMSLHNLEPGVTLELILERFGNYPRTLLRIVEAGFSLPSNFSRIASPEAVKAEYEKYFSELKTKRHSTLIPPEAKNNSAQ